MNVNHNQIEKAWQHFRASEWKKAAKAIKRFSRTDIIHAIGTRFFHTIGRKQPRTVLVMWEDFIEQSLRGDYD